MSLARIVIDNLYWYAEQLARTCRECCTECYLCIGVCPTYLATGNPHYTPLNRLKIALRILLEDYKPQEAEVEALFTCTGCGACSIACPLRLPLWLTIHFAKCVCQLKGYAPHSLKVAAKAAEKSLHSFSIDHKASRKWIKGVNAWTGPGDYLYVPTPVENLFYFMEAQAKVKLFKTLGVPYTVSPLAQDIGGNMAIDLARPDIAAYALARAVIEAENRGAKMIIVSECGADNKWAFEVAPILLKDAGIEPRMFIPIHVLVLKYLEKRRLDVTRRAKVIGLFSSCTFGRILALYENLKKIALMIAERVEEPKWRGKYVACCGGSCLNVLRESWAKKLRLQIGLSRITSYTSSTVVVPCTKCYISFKQSLLSARRRDKRVKLLTTALLESISQLNT